MFSDINIPMILTNPDLYDADGNTMPVYATEGSVAIDLRANVADDIVLQPNECRLIPVGIRLDMSNHACVTTHGEGNTLMTYKLPNGLSLCCDVLPRSGRGHKEGLICGNGLGLIDEDYQGEIHCSLWNRSTEVRTVLAGERFAQMRFLLAVRPTFNLVSEFQSTTARGEGGFGHSGQN